MEQLDVYKHVSWVVLLVLTLIGAFIPWLIKLRKKGKTVISFLICLAAGVIIGTLLMHMIPHLIPSHGSECGSHNGSSAASHVGHNHTASHGHTGHSHNGKPCTKNHKHEPSKTAEPHGHELTQGVSELGSHTTGHGNSQPVGHNHSSNDSHEHAYPFGLLSAGISFFVLVAIDRLFLAHSHCEETNDVCDKKHFVCDPEKAVAAEVKGSHPSHALASIDSKDASCADSSAFSQEHAHGHDHCHDEAVGGCHMEGISTASSKLHAVSFMVAIGLHSFFEALALGSVSTTQKLWGMFIGIGAHKVLEALTLGIAIIKGRFSNLFSVLVIIGFSFISPLGVLIGQYALRHDDSSYDPTSARSIAEQVLNGLAAGSFFFIACIEMIPSEFHTKNHLTKWKLLVCFAGFAVMAGLAKIHVH